MDALKMVRGHQENVSTEKANFTQIVFRYYYFFHCQIYLPG